MQQWQRVEPDSSGLDRQGLGLGLRGMIGGIDHPHDRQAILTTDNGRGLVGNDGKKGACLLLKAVGAFSG